MQRPPRFPLIWVAIGAAALLAVPWYGLDDRLSAPALFAGVPWLWPLALPLLLSLCAVFGRPRPHLLIAASAADNNGKPYALAQSRILTGVVSMA